MIYMSIKLEQDGTHFHDKLILPVADATWLPIKREGLYKKELAANEAISTHTQLKPQVYKGPDNLLSVSLYQ